VWCGSMLGVFGCGSSDCEVLMVFGLWGLVLVLVNH